jgi:hypothetical protein
MTMHQRNLARAAALLIFLLALTCSDLPNDPFAPDNARVSLVLMSYGFESSDSSIVDTVGRIIRVGVCLYLTQHIDSTEVSITSSAKIDTVIWCRKKNKQIDTAFYDVLFSNPGDRTVTATAHVGKDLRQVTAKIHIVVRPVPNRAPVLTVTGSRYMVAGQTCSLTVIATDPDSGQTIAIGMLKSPTGSLFQGNTFTWNTTITDTGVDTVEFIATDNGTPVLSDFEKVAITITIARTNHPPKWNNDTVLLTGQIGSPVSLTLGDKCSDPDNDPLTFRILPGVPDSDTIIGSTYSFTPSIAHQGTFYPRAVARDSSSSEDTLTLNLTISVADKIPPTLKLIAPAKDSTSVNASSLTVRVTATDVSGIASVACSMNSASFTTTCAPGDSVFSANVTELSENQFNTITFIATDSSLAANQCTLSVHIKFDPTIADSIGPVFFQKHGPTTGAVITDSIVSVIDSIIDPSGVDSVYWTLNGTNKKPMIGDRGTYTLSDTLRRYHLDTIIVFAQDKSTNQNRSRQMIVLDYNVSPIAKNTSISTNMNVAKTILLAADAIDGDALSNWSYTQSVNGTVTGTGPSVIYTPDTDFFGLDSFSFTVSDGKYNSNSAMVKIMVIDSRIAPSIITDIVDLTLNKSQTATFTIVINANVDPAPTYKWEKEGSTNSLGTGLSFTRSNVTYLDSGRYHVIVTNSKGSITSKWAKLIVADITKPVIALIGSNDTTILAGAPFYDPFATAYDDFPVPGTDISQRIERSSSPNPFDSTKIGRYTLMYRVSDAATPPNKDSLTRTVRVEGWETTAPSTPIIGNYPQTVIADNGDLYLSFVFNGQISVKKLPFNATAWMDVGGSHISNDIINDYKMVLSNNKMPYIAYIARSGSVDYYYIYKYNGSSWVQPNSACSPFSTTDNWTGFAVSAKDSAVLTIFNGDLWFYAHDANLCLMANYGYSSPNPEHSLPWGFDLQFNPMDSLYCVLSDLGGVKVKCAKRSRIDTIPQAPGISSPAGGNTVKMVFNRSDLYIMRTSGSISPQVWKAIGNSWTSLGGNTPLFSGQSTSFYLIYANDASLYAAYSDDLKQNVVIKKYNSVSDSWSTYPAVTMGKTPTIINTTSFSIQIFNGRCYVTYPDNSGNIVTLKYQPQ